MLCIFATLWSIPWSRLHVVLYCHTLVGSCMDSLFCYLLYISLWFLFPSLSLSLSKLYTSIYLTFTIGPTIPSFILHSSHASSFSFSSSLSLCTSLYSLSLSLYIASFLPFPFCVFIMQLFLISLLFFISLSSLNLLLYIHIIFFSASLFVCASLCLSSRSAVSFDVCRYFSFFDLSLSVLCLPFSKSSSSYSLSSCRTPPFSSPLFTHSVCLSLCLLISEAFIFHISIILLLVSVLSQLLPWTSFYFVSHVLAKSSWLIPIWTSRWPYLCFEFHPFRLLALLSASLCVT